MNRDTTASSGSCGCVLVFILINLLLGGICTEYVVEFWSSYFKEVAVDVSFWPCALAGLFLGEITIPLALFTYIMSFVL
ncbi:hypothetical protein GW933_03560 [Candidatus Falkowbacteria bacterium]|uniref:Uncharacterized protein n=1 Tax=Candidatus Buchananbacteria bacterium CG10_big_fil_rev_8_21_14_0_10_33_19 TaxID=1974525 RepID=A0A2H0W4U3_9BACT|nr:hypothetical protein [Candidatus Falkowbacteria bacterium]PIS06375.1 MAG: hypothetical protein COT80_02305 [Candidatus Buchananbacteria bacterium CG10_big_fil_rev_8_21_14_0_10_33_19]